MIWPKRRGSLMTAVRVPERRAEAVGQRPANAGPRFQKGGGNSCSRRIGLRLFHDLMKRLIRHVYINFFAERAENDLRTFDQPSHFEEVLKL